MSRRLHALLALSISWSVLAGCVSTGRVQYEVTQQMRLGDFGEAIQTVVQERNRSFRGKNRLLYYLELGMLLHVDGQYEASNQVFEEAKSLGNALYTKSLSSAGLSFVTNDYAIAYAGENFERTLIHLFAAMNYHQLGEDDSALVEVRQVGEYLRKLQIDTPNQNVYQEDAFARYLSALLYEMDGDDDAAFVDYKKALDAYDDYDIDFAVSRPASLEANAWRLADRLGEWAQEELLERESRAPAREIPPGSGELVLLHYNGLAPVKDQTVITIPFASAWPLVVALQATADPVTQREIAHATAVIGAIRGFDLVPVAFPRYVGRRYSIARMEPYVDGASQITGPELVEDIGAIARKDLEDRKARIYAKSVARAAIKYAIQKGFEAAARRSGDGDGEAAILAGAQILGTIARYASEQADKRVWSTLPDQIFMTSMILPAGRHDLEVDFLTRHSTIVESRSLPGIELQPGERRFVILRTVN